MDDPNYKQYLGDGVYADYDGYAVVLTTGTDVLEEADSKIYLEPDIIRQLEEYVQRLRHQLEGRL